MYYKPDSGDTGRIKEIEDRSKQSMEEMSKEAKLASKFCAVGEHQTEEQLYYCKHCHRTFCAEHGDEERGLCNDDIADEAGETEDLD